MSDIKKRTNWKIEKVDSLLHKLGAIRLSVDLMMSEIHALYGALHTEADFDESDESRNE